MGKFITSRLLPALVAGSSPVRRRIRSVLLVLASICLILALARPQWGFNWQEVKQRGVDIVVAIDCSKSMLAADIAPNRLARAKLAALELMQKARTDRLGLVAFAGSAFLACPLTIDEVAFAQSVESLDVNTISLGGTAIAEAIDTALTAFKEADNHKLLVLMTDGEDHDSAAVQAAEKASQAGLRIYTVGIGTPEGELVQVRDAQGQTDYVRDEQGNVVKSRLNEQLLAQIATATKGGAYLLRGAKTIDTLYEQSLATLPKSEHDQKLVKQFHQRYHWPLAAGILLLLAEQLLPERGRGPGSRLGLHRKRAASLTAAALALLAAISAAPAASPGGALREYKAGKYEKALKDYEELLKRKSDDPRLHFNAGAAAYRNGQYADAAKQFDAAVGSPDLGLQESAFYNRGNSLFWLGEQAKEPRQRMQHWEKALQDFELTSKLNTNDVDAKFNYEFVKKRLEELKQQQQQQGDKDQNKSDQQQKDQNRQKNTTKQDQNQQQQEQQQQSQQQQSQQQEESQQEQSKPEQSQQQEQARNQQPEQKQPGQGDQQPKPDAQREQEKAAQAAAEKEAKEKEEKAAAAGQMTPEQARQLMDSQKGRDKMLSQRLQKPTDRSKRIKDW